VVSDEEKAPVRCQVGTRKANVSESLTKCRDDYQHDIETGVSGCLRDEPGGSPLSGQVVSGMKAAQAWSAAAGLSSSSVKAPNVARSNKPSTWPGNFSAPYQPPIFVGSLLHTSSGTTALTLPARTNRTCPALLKPMNVITQPLLDPLITQTGRPA
jgi:hypothetical protein